MKTLRALLILGRVSNLPTVWSNCLAGWLLGGGGNDGWGLVLLCAGATSLYIGGMYLNDAFDAEFDTQHRRERPIPSGAIAEKAVWQLGFTWLVGGLMLLAPFGLGTALLAVLLVAAILVYDAVHKAVVISPLLMALCRLLLYLVAASTAAKGVTGLAMWSALALASYIVGLSYLARKESSGVVVQRWPLVLLAVPVALAWLVNDSALRIATLPVAAILLLWIMRTLRPLWGGRGNIPRAVSGLLAGIVWVDFLAVADAPLLYGAIFIGLFLLALGFQRVVPAT
jgi:hypothetical protein